MYDLKLRVAGCELVSNGPDRVTCECGGRRGIFNRRMDWTGIFALTKRKCSQSSLQSKLLLFFTQRNLRNGKQNGVVVIDPPPIFIGPFTLGGCPRIFSYLSESWRKKIQRPIVAPALYHWPLYFLPTTLGNMRKKYETLLCEWTLCLWSSSLNFWRRCALYERCVELFQSESTPSPIIASGPTQSDRELAVKGNVKLKKAKTEAKKSLR